MFRLRFKQLIMILRLVSYSKIHIQIECFFCVFLSFSFDSGVSHAFHHQRNKDAYNTFDEVTTLHPFNPIMSSKWNEPQFDNSMPNNVTALVGKSAYLSCKVRNLGNRTVSVSPPHPHGPFKILNVICRMSLFKIILR